MKGIVAEINGKYAVILTNEGLFKKIKAEPHMTVGSEIDINCPKDNGNKTKLITRVTSLAAAALLALGIGHGVYSYSMPYSYVDFDINPSIELTVNIYDRIIGTEALNNDGEALLDSRKLKNTRLSEAVSQLISSAAEQGYFKSDAADPNEVQNTVLFTVSSNNGNKSKALKDKLAYAIEEELSKGSIVSDVLVGEASLEQRDDARKVGTTPGKLALIENAMKAEPELELEELKSAAVKDLVAKVKNNKPTKDEKAAAGTNNSESKKNGDKVTQSASKDDEKGIKVVWEDEDNNGRNEQKDKNRTGDGNSSKAPDRNEQVEGSKANRDSKDSKGNGKSGGSGNVNDKGNGNGNRDNRDNKANNSNREKNNADDKNNNRKNNNNNNNNMKKQQSEQDEKKLERERQKLRDELLKQIHKYERWGKSDNKKDKGKR